MASLVGLAAASRVQIEMVADVVCPYCYIGLDRLHRALATVPDTAVDVTYTPFILRRHLPKTGVLKLDVFRQQFGDAAQGERVLAQVQAAAAANGLCFDNVDQRAGNSEDAHRLLLDGLGLGLEVRLSPVELEVTSSVSSQASSSTWV